jgi:hypothetical protein
MKLVITLCICLIGLSLFAQQNVGIGTTTPHASAMLDITSVDKGLLIPRLTFTNRPATPATGLLIYQTDNTPGFYFFDGTNWELLTTLTSTVSGSGTSGQLAFFNSSNSLTSSSSLLWNNSLKKLSVSGLNNGTVGAGFTNWISADFGGTGGNRVVMGVQNGEATIGAHNSSLSGWEKLVLNPAGAIKLPSLAGVGSRMVVAGTDGVLTTQAIPPSVSDNLGNHTATQNINLNNFKITGGGTQGLSINDLGQVTIDNLAHNGTQRIVTVGPNGELTTQSSLGDNLGNHQAGTNIAMSNNWISNSGSNNGLRISSAGAVGINVIPEGNSVFDVAKLNGATYEAGGLSVKQNGFVGVGTSSPTANLDVMGTLRFRNGAIANGVLRSDANGNATWGSASSASLLTTSNFNLNNNWLSNNATATGMRIDNSGNVGVGVVPSGSNRLEVNGTGGLNVSTTNIGIGTYDWIGLNVGGSNGNRLVGGLLEGVATIGGHNAGLNTWSHLAINPSAGSGSTVTIGADANATPSSTGTSGVLNRTLTVNGSIRQSFYQSAVTIGANNTATIVWNHNLGYGPIVMMSTDQNGGGSFMDYVNVTTYNNDANNTVFLLRNTGGNNATGTLRWILIW